MRGLGCQRGPLNRLFLSAFVFLFCAARQCEGIYQLALPRVLGFYEFGFCRCFSAKTSQLVSTKHGLAGINIRAPFLLSAWEEIALKRRARKTCTKLKILRGVDSGRRTKL